MRWKVTGLKDFLRKRGLAYSMNKAELAALCYSAAKFKLPIKLTPHELKKEKAQTYQSLLATSTGVLPDPFELTVGWVREDKGIELWPPTMLLEIQGILLCIQFKFNSWYLIAPVKHCNKYLLLNRHKGLLVTFIRPLCKLDIWFTRQPTQIKFRPPKKKSALLYHDLTKSTII